MSPWSFQDDLDAMFAALEGHWPKLAGKSVFMTGGTGFIGRWMLEALADADRRLSLGIKVTILTRDPAAFREKAPDLANYPAFALLAASRLPNVTNARLAS